MHCPRKRFDLYLATSSFQNKQRFVLLVRKALEKFPVNSHTVVRSFIDYLECASDCEFYHFFTRHHARALIADIKCMEREHAVLCDSMPDFISILEDAEVMIPSCFQVESN